MGALLAGLTAAVVYGLLALTWCSIVTDAPVAYHARPTRYGSPTAKTAYRDRYVHAAYGQPSGYTRRAQDLAYLDGTSRGL